MLEDLIEGWDGEETVIGLDRPVGTWMFVCVHSTVRGPAAGGTRMAVYRAPARRTVLRATAYSRASSSSAGRAEPNG